jgi:S-adenosylhomocysteine hydrolase
MGFLTTFTVYNDSAHLLKELKPGEAVDLAQRLYNACVIGKKNSISIRDHVNAIQVQKCRHADDHMIYIHRGNCLSEFNPYDTKLIESYPNMALDDYKLVKDFLKKMKKSLLEKGFKVT